MKPVAKSASIADGVSVLRNELAVADAGQDFEYPVMLGHLERAAGGLVDVLEFVAEHYRNMPHADQADIMRVNVALGQARASLGAARERLRAAAWSAGIVHSNM